MSDEAGRPLSPRTNAEEPPVRRRTPTTLGVLAVTTLAGFLADQGSKAWAFGAPGGADGPRGLVPGVLTTVLARNDGAMANPAGGRPGTATLCALQGLAFLAAAAWYGGRRRGRWRRRDAAFAGVLAAGVAGNAADRLALGHVRDFLATPLWPVWIFNPADVFILFGFLGLLGSWALARGGGPAPAPAGAGQPDARPATA